MNNDNSPDNAPASNFIRNMIAEDITNNKHGGRVHTRFPPEPNGYLHLGHAKAICVNFGLALQYSGDCNLRFDDTNPEKENDEYMRSIQEDVSWLGFEWSELHYASDYFDALYDFALELIDKNLAYIDSLTAEQMRDAVLAASAGADVVVMAAAVADFRPVAVAGRKLKKQDGLPEIVLAANKDILAELGANRSEGLMLVGFAAETNDVVANAVEKLERKNIDMIIANDVHEVGAGFSTDTNRVTIITHGHQVEVKLGSKYEIAQAVISSICDHLELD